MKRFVAIILVLLMLGANAFCEGIDFSVMSDEELVALVDNARQECFNRGIARSGELNPGVYVVGRDVAAASYNVKTSDPDSYTQFCIFNSLEDYEIYKDLSSRMELITGKKLLSEEDVKKIDLYDNQVLIIDHASMMLEEVTSNLMP